MATVEIPTPSGTMPAHLAVPDQDGPWPGVVVIHDALGMTTDLRRQADWLADEGFLAIAPDLYHWGSRMRCLITAMRGVASGRGRTYDDIDAARRWLASHDGHTGRTGVIGFCLGGSYALAVATGAYDASSVNYGFIDDPAQALRGACPIVGSFGAKDCSLTDVPQTLDDVLTELDIDHDIKVYDDAGHGFLNNHAPGEKPLWARFFGSFVNDGYHEPSATDARQRIVEFFDTHLRR